VLMNHELGQTLGAVREHGSTGAFVSRLTVDMTTHEVLDAKDLSEDVFRFNRTTNAYEETTTQFGRLCSADLPAVSAFYDAATGLGTTERIFMDGEEIGNEGRAFAHIVTGAEAGDSYELPRSAACPGKTQWRMRIAARKLSSCATTTPRLVKSMSISAISRRPVMPSKKPVSRTARSSVFPLHSVTTPDPVP